MNSKNTALLGLSIGAIFAIMVFGPAFQSVEAAKPNALGKPDFIAKLNESGLPTSDSDSVGQAFFWFGEDGGELSLKYKIMLHKIALDEEGQQGAIDEVLTKIHVHFAPDGVHTPMHLFNILYPEDDAETVMVDHRGNIIIVGEWDKDDSLGCDIPMHHFGHQSKPFDCEIAVDNGSDTPGNGLTVLENLCSEQTDLNIHTTGGAINGILVPKSKACDELLG